MLKKMKKKRKRLNVNELTKHIKDFKNTCLNEKQKLRKFNEKLEHIIREFEKESQRIIYLKEF